MCLRGIYLFIIQTPGQLVCVRTSLDSFQFQIEHCKLTLCLAGGNKCKECGFNDFLRFKKADASVVRLFDYFDCRTHCGGDRTKVSRQENLDAFIPSVASSLHTLGNKVIVGPHGREFLHLAPYVPTLLLAMYCRGCGVSTSGSFKECLCSQLCGNQRPTATGAPRM